MLGKGTTIIIAAIATAMVATFVIGLAYSISTGFAGFWGGLPFWIIVTIVLGMALYDFWEDAVKGSDSKKD